MVISSKVVSGLMLGVVTSFALAACGSGQAESPALATATVAEVAPQSSASTGASSEPEVAPTRTATPEPLPTGEPQPTFPPPPDLDRSIHSVEMSDIHFDRFDGSSTRLSSASNELIERLRDAIKPIYRANYVDPGTDDWLEANDLVVGYVGHESGQAFAYPLKFLNFHELVNDEIDGIPLIITYCPLCGSGVVFDRRIDDQTLVFGNTSALYNSDLVMFDHQTGSYWFQTGGEAVVGTLTGSRLEPLPSSVMGWGDWLELHPNTRVLSREQGLGTRPSQYLNDPFSTYADFINGGEDRYPFPVDGELINEALRPAEIVLAVEVDGVERAYPPGRVGDAAVNDQIGDKPVVVLSRGTSQSATVFSPVLEADARLLEFEFSDGEFRDLQTGSIWNFGGLATAGELEGAKLNPLPSRRAFWFSISISNPEIDIYNQ
jgi:hypothetical protein